MKDQTTKELLQWAQNRVINHALDLKDPIESLEMVYQFIINNGTGNDEQAKIAAITKLTIRQLKGLQERMGLV